jgi:hypothetical protein
MASVRSVLAWTWQHTEKLLGIVALVVALLALYIAKVRRAVSMRPRR